MAQAEKLIEELLEDIDFLSKTDDCRTAFDVEYKCREHISRILKDSIRPERALFRIEHERTLPIFFRRATEESKGMAGRSYRPDFEIMKKDS